MNTSFFVTGWNYGNNKYIMFGRLFSVLILLFSCLAYMVFGVNGLLLSSLLYIALLLSFIIIMLINMNKERKLNTHVDGWPEVEPLTEQDY